MKNYKITVNGNIYDVAVEEVGGVTAAPMTTYAAPVPAAQIAPAASAAPVASSAEGAVKIAAPMPGKILSIVEKVGAKVKKGQAIIILEAMKMENEIVALEDGTVTSINVNEGASVEAGVVLATLN